MILNAFAVTLAHPDPAAVVAGADSTRSAPRWSLVRLVVGKPFAAVVLVAFLACGMAAQASTARGIYSVARDGGLPGSRFLRAVDRRRRRSAAIVATPSSRASGCCSASTRRRSGA